MDAACIQTTQLWQFYIDMLLWRNEDSREEITLSVTYPRTTTSTTNPMWAALVFSTDLRCQKLSAVGQDLVIPFFSSLL